MQKATAAGQVRLLSPRWTRIKANATGSVLRNDFAHETEAVYFCSMTHHVGQRAFAVDIQRLVCFLRCITTTALKRSHTRTSYSTHEARYAIQRETLPTTRANLHQSPIGIYSSPLGPSIYARLTPRNTRSKILIASSSLPCLIAWSIKVLMVTLSGATPHRDISS